MAPEDKQSLPSLSTEDNKKPDRLQKDRKTAWDWSELFIKIIGALAIPISIIVLIVNVHQFNEQQSASARMQATQVAATQAQTLDQQQQTTLDTYLDRISNLLLTYPDHFKAYKPGDQYQVIAEARTLTAVRNLDGPRKGTLIRFLWEANLITIGPKMPQPIINLNGANLSGAIFSGGSRQGAGLILHLPPIVTPNGQFISPGADLQDVSLSGAILEDTNLSYAFLEGADLSYADLKGADLFAANLKDAHNLTQQQLDQVKTCLGAILPPGLTCNRTQSPS